MLLSPFDVVTPYGAAAITLEVYEEADALVAGIRGCDIVHPTKGRLLSAVRSAMPVIEDICRKAGIQELRLGGRDWSRLLKDFQPLDGVPNGLRKRLTHG